MMWNTRRNAHSAPGASCTAGLHKPRFIRRAILPVCLTTSWVRSIWFSGSRSWSPCSLRTTPQLLRRTRWSPRLHLLRILSSSLLRAGSRAERWGESCDPTWLCQQHKHIRCEHGVCTIYHSHNKKCGTRGYKCKNWAWCAWMVSAGGVGIVKKSMAGLCLSSALDNIGTYVRN